MKAIVASVIVGITVIAGYAEATRTTRYFAGSYCAGNTPGDTDCLARRNDGCLNYCALSWPTCSDSLTVILPVAWSNSSSGAGGGSSQVAFSDAKVTYNKSNALEVACTLTVTIYGGTEYSSDTLSTTSSSGYGVLEWDGTMGKHLPDLGADIYPSSQIQFVCSLPGSEEVGSNCTGGNYIVGYETTGTDY